MRPDATSSRTAIHDGCWRYMNASISRTPGLARRRRPCACASAAVIASGFSHSTCLPARAAAIVHSRVEVVGQRDVDGVDVGVGEERLVRPVRARDPQPVPRPRSPARPRATRCPGPRCAASDGGPGSPSRSRCSPSTARPSGASIAASAVAVPRPGPRRPTGRPPRAPPMRRRRLDTDPLVYESGTRLQERITNLASRPRRRRTAQRNGPPGEPQRHRPRPPRARPPVPLRARRRDRPDAQRDPRARR